MSVSKATCPESVFETVQIILWETPVTKSSRRVFKNLNLVRVLLLISNWASFFNNKIFFKFRSVRMRKLLCFFILSGFLLTVNSKYFSICDAASYENWILKILNCKLWDKFLISMIILFLIISYILIFHRNFELIFEFMALKRAPICGQNVCLSFFFFWVFLCLIVIILIEENKKNLTQCQNNVKWTKILLKMF